MSDQAENISASLALHFSLCYNKNIPFRSRIAAYPRTALARSSQRQPALPHSHRHAPAADRTAYDYIPPQDMFFHEHASLMYSKPPFRLLTRHCDDAQ